MVDLSSREIDSNTNPTGFRQVSNPSLYYPNQEKNVLAGVLLYSLITKVETTRVTLVNYIMYTSE